MEVVFRTRKPEQEYHTNTKAVKADGEQVARKYIQRIAIIKSARDIDELLGFPGLRCHALKGNRMGHMHSS